MPALSQTMAASPYRVELAKSDRSTCTATKEKIAKGELRFGALVPSGSHSSYKWRKMACVTAKQAANIREAVGGPEHLDGYAELSEGHRAQVLEVFATVEAAAAAAPAAGKKAKAKAPPAAAPSAKRPRAAPKLPADATAAAHALLDLAKANKWADVFRALDTRPELVNVRPEVRQYSLLHQAVYLGRVENVTRLLDQYGASASQCTKGGETCADLAAGKPEVAALLASRRAPAAAEDLTPEKVAKRASGATADEEEAAHALIDLAKGAGWSQLFAALDERSELVNMRPAVREYGVLHQAAYHGASDAVTALVERYSADPAERTKSGLTVAQVARERGHVEVAAWLESCVEAAGAAGAEVAETPLGAPAAAASAALAPAASPPLRSAVDAHGLIDMAKDGRWPELFSALGTARELANVRPEVREYGILHQAAYHGAADAVARLVNEFGTDPAALTRSGRSAAEVAEERGHHGVASDLRAREETPDDDLDMVQQADGSWAIVQRSSAKSSTS